MGTLSQFFSKGNRFEAGCWTTFIGIILISAISFYFSTKSTTRERVVSVEKIVENNGRRGHVATTLVVSTNVRNYDVSTRGLFSHPEYVGLEIGATYNITSFGAEWPLVGMRRFIIKAEKVDDNEL